jgi:outer membrane protein assembly factor BamB
VENPRRTVVATPVFAEGRVYFAAGREWEFCSSKGRLFCIDPSKTGDISPELDDGKGGGKENPNSGLLWDFTKDGDKEPVIMGETISCVAVCDGLVIALDEAGAIHCFDAKTGKRYWTHDDNQPGQFGDPLIADGKVYVADQGGSVTILELSKEYNVIAKPELNQLVYASPVFANGTLYILSRHTLFAIGPKK